MPERHRLLQAGAAQRLEMPAKHVTGPFVRHTEILQECSDARAHPAPPVGKRKMNSRVAVHARRIRAAIDQPPPVAAVLATTAPVELSSAAARTTNAANSRRPGLTSAGNSTCTDTGNRPHVPMSKRASLRPASPRM